MKISRLWLQKYFEGPLPDAQALADALTFHAFEIESVEKAGADDVLDVKITPNRGHDALSHRGIAKELSAILKLPLASDPFASASDISKKSEDVTVSIDTPLCRRYIAGYIKGVKVGPSPKWLRERLEAMGQRSINNVVDATNFVMFNTGQPLHAFDAKKLPSLEIGVRAARGGEKLMALDKKEYALLPSMLVITAGDEAVGIAGVKGGMPAAIDEATTDIVIESANFDGASVRKTAQALKLRTDASVRFEQGLSPELAARGMEGMMEFIQHMIGGEAEGFVDIYPEPQRVQTVAVTLKQINETLGTSFSDGEVADVFTRLAFEFSHDKGSFEVNVPYERLDISIPQDLIEEVGRIIGYEAVPNTALSPLSRAPEVNAEFYKEEQVRQFLVGQGFSEIIGSAFADRGERVVLNKVDGVRPYVRGNIEDGLKDALERNVRNKELLGLPQVRLFEIGTVWNKNGEERQIAIAVEKVKGQKLQEEYQRELDAFISSISTPDTYGDTPIPPAVRFKPFSKYPYIVRDVAVWVPSGTDEGDVLSLIQEKAGGLAIRVEQFDRFEKEGRVSLAFRIIFQSFDRTLEDGEANAAMEKVYAALREQGFEIR